jgi:hypothetical protein
MVNIGPIPNAWVGDCHVHVQGMQCACAMCLLLVWPTSQSPHERLRRRVEGGQKWDATDKNILNTASADGGPGSPSTRVSMRSEEPAVCSVAEAVKLRMRRKVHQKIRSWVL